MGWLGKQEAKSKIRELSSAPVTQQRGWVKKGKKRGGKCEEWIESVRSQD